MAINFYQGEKSYFLDYQNDSDEEKIRIIKNRISEFFNMKNVHFLFGSGTSCPAIPNMKGLLKKVKEAIDKNTEIKEDFKAKINPILTKSEDNLEEILGVLYSMREYIKGFVSDLNKSVDYNNCDKLISVIEETIFNEINAIIYNDADEFVASLQDDFEEKKNKINAVLDTYKKFYQKLALRNKDLSRLNIFTTNNDLFNETALDSLNIHYINGFNGGLNKYFNPAMFNYTFSKRMDTSIDRFEPVENMVYLYKIHGSINWVEDTKNANSYFDIKEEFCPKYDKTKSVLIYPTPMKQNKSLGSPYADLFREFQHKLLEPNSVLFVIGYSFSDEHVNNIIYRALATNSTFNLVIINEIDDKKEICNISDNRIYRIWETTENNDNKLHYFNNIVEKLLPNLDAFKQNDILVDFVKHIKEGKQKINDENR